MTTRAERQGRNESLFREVNERIAELNQTFQVEGRAPAVAAGLGAVWIVDTAHGTLLRVQPVP